jgi:hypothetical protein
MTTRRASLSSNPMMALRVSRGGAEVAVVHFFGHGTADEPQRCSVASGELPTSVVADIWAGVHVKPRQGTIGEYAYRLDDPPPESPLPRRRRR